ncbi:uncharacterized protein LOC133627696 [Colius striatus]|uniref:uncharacterized protein LOC133627696 n=1 Tax=Colius striatus TaxID=57412 RepID=UPI002B1D855D|nr:uncharacterized protein LOC133627696 [Colius striatus]
MKRRGRGGAARQAGACDVWLDTAERKQSAAQSLIAKPKVSGWILESRKALAGITQTRTSQLRTKQTTISAFFSTQTDKKDKENCRPYPFTLNKDCKGKSICLPACPVKILALPQVEEAQKQSLEAEEETVQVTPQHRAQKALASPAPLPDPWVFQVESHSKSKAFSGVGEDCCIFSFTQDTEGNRIIAHRNQPDLFSGETISASVSVTSECGIKKQQGRSFLGEVRTRLDFQPGLGANHSKNPHQSSQVNILTDFSETETINPAITQDSTWAVGFYSSPRRPDGAQPLQECSQNAGTGPAKDGHHTPCRQLFTQDSEGNRVIAHCGWKVSSPHRDEDSSHRKLLSYTDRRDAANAVKRILSTAGEQPLEVCYDVLFTQDSEGNRVIKHWYGPASICGRPMQQ